MRALPGLDQTRALFFRLQMEAADGGDLELLRDGGGRVEMVLGEFEMG